MNSDKKRFNPFTWLRLQKSGGRAERKNRAAVDSAQKIQTMYENFREILTLNDSTLQLKLSVAELAAQGFVSNQAVDPNQKALPLTLQGAQGDEYWLGLNNFYVITRYNHSPLYAMAVFQLSQEIKRAKQLKQ